MGVLEHFDAVGLHVDLAIFLVLFLLLIQGLGLCCEGLFDVFGHEGNHVGFIPLSFLLGDEIQVGLKVVRAIDGGQVGVFRAESFVTFEKSKQSQLNQISLDIHIGLIDHLTRRLDLLQNLAVVHPPVGFLVNRQQDHHIDILDIEHIFSLRSVHPHRADTVEQFKLDHTVVFEFLDGIYRALSDDSWRIDFEVDTVRPEGVLFDDQLVQEEVVLTN